jgi:DNA-binding GntR family transcriptional regulator
VDGQVVGYEIRYLPTAVGEALTPEEITGQPLVPAVRRVLGKPRTKLALYVTASGAGPREAKLLQVKVGAPVLVREHVWHYEPEGPMQYGKSIFRGDRYQIYEEFTSSPSEAGWAGPPGQAVNGEPTEPRDLRSTP